MAVAPEAIAGLEVMARGILTADLQVRLPREAMASGPWASGDILSFALEDTDRIVIRRINAEQDPDYLTPLRDSFGCPIPPGWLNQAFTSIPDAEQSIRNGYASAQLISAWAAECGVDMASAGTIFDFGCGCGRVLRHWPRFTKASVVACDLKAQSVDWLTRHMPFGRYFTGSEAPPIAIESGSVDVLYAISVLTHLDRQSQLDWLAEWRRMVKPDGVVIATFHGEDMIEKRFGQQPVAMQRMLDRLRDGGGVSFTEDRGWDNIFPEFYQTACNSTAYVKAEWTRHFRIARLVPSGGFANHQNAVVLVPI